MKARYMMDTDTCIYLKNRRPPAIAERFRSLQWGEVVMSVITFGELYNGAMKSQETTAALNNVNRLGERLPVQFLSVEVAKSYAIIRSSLEKKGAIIGGNDLWIAAHAMTLDLTVITNNTKEFNRVENLRIENWV
ncbi:MAG: VapC toxin family PIN domain ribonuclease [Gammaproteobacteria bacterium]|nr:MAG: VapC toxin family PIN domain ribonuclease [Gammaproteobacteria bacterium]